MPGSYHVFHLLMIVLPGGIEVGHALSPGGLALAAAGGAESFAWSFLEFAQGRLFRFAFALMILGLLRLAALSLWETVGGYVTAADRSAFWAKARQRVMWFLLPSVVLQRAEGSGGTVPGPYHLLLSMVSLVFRLGAIVVPAFMVAHVYLWERGLGISWPTLPGRVADVFSIVTIVAGVLLFVGRLYSPVLRRLDPAWSFLKPLILILPFITGVLAMHPTWSPIDYHVMMLFHVISGVLVLVLLPFARMLAFVHRPVTDILPEARWQPEEAVGRVVG